MWKRITHIWNVTCIVWKSFIYSILEVSLLILPVGLYAATLIFMGAGTTISELPGWAFTSFSMFALMSRDSINAFRHREEDQPDRNASAIISIIGLGISGVLMTLSIVRSQNPTFQLPIYFDTVVFLSIFLGFSMAVLTKSILMQRDIYGRIQ